MNKKHHTTFVYVVSAIGLIAYLVYDWAGRHEFFQFCLSLLIVVAAVILGRFPDRDLVRAALVSIAGFAAIRLIVWRVLCTLNLTSPFNSLASFALLSAEIYAVMGFFMVAMQNGYLFRREVPKIDPTFTPDVDVFIPTYNESIEILRRTICGAKNINYENKKVYVLDDGRREAVLNLALQMGVNYITRPDNLYAKAGNINNAMSQTGGSLLLILDADHIPSTTFLERTVPFFSDAKVACVQTIHRFMNAAPVQRNLRMEGKLPHEQELFFQISMVGKDHWNAAIFAGSAGLIRRSVLDEMGGMSRGTVIEDCEFSLDMHRRNYVSVYLPEALTIGLSPETLSAYLVQQGRWACGQTQMLVLANPFFIKGKLTLAQRICYLNNNLYYLFGLPRLIYFAIPVLFLLFGVCPTSVSWMQYLMLASPFLFAWLIGQNYIYKNYRHSFWSDVYEAILAPHTLLWTMLTLLDPSSPRFAVTPKGTRTKRFFFDIKSVFVNLILLAVCLGAFLVGFLKLILQFDPIGNLANLVFDAYNIVLLSCACLVGFERPQLRRAHRVNRAIPVSVEVDGIDRLFGGSTQDVSEFGARLRILAKDVTMHKNDVLKVHMENDDGELVDVDAKLIRVIPDGEFLILELEFINVSTELLERLICTAYCSPNYWNNLSEPSDSILRSLFDLLETPLRVAGELRKSIIRLGIVILVSPKVLKSKLIPLKLRPLLVTVEDLPQSPALAVADNHKIFSENVEEVDYP